MKNQLMSWTLGVLICGLTMNAVAEAENQVEVRTLQTWNLPHPFEGPKTLTEDVFAYLMHPMLRDYAGENTLDISYSKEDDCLYVLGSGSLIRPVEETLTQLNSYSHPYSSLFAATKSGSNNKEMVRFPNICANSGGLNLLRLEVESLPVLVDKWNEPVRYGFRPKSYPTLGDYQFPKTVMGTKGKAIRGELSFSPNIKNQSQAIHVLSYAGMSKEDLRNFLNNPGGEERVYLDVPYRKLLPRGDSDNPAEWSVFRASSKALKMMCPNYNNPRINALFRDVEYRRIVQKTADLVYHTGAVGLTDTGLQPIHRSNVLEDGGWRQFSSDKFKRERQQLANEWKAWLTAKSKSSDGQLGAGLRVKNGQKLVDIDTNDLPKFRLFFADNINDTTYFVNLKELLGEEELGLMNLEIRRGDDFIPVDKFRKVLAGDEQLSDGHEGVVFDIPVPFNHHVEHYFSKDRNFFGLDRNVAIKTVSQAEAMLNGDWTEGATKKMGSILREEVPCIIVGKHPFFIYTRKHGDYLLSELPYQEQQKKSPTATTLAGRISASGSR
ncbi:MAG: hypothetical protein CL402_06285 [Acidiferrobacteraceae bacterium]|nr:hypothetical protein [Acidiferrobacteraceae bacterium]|tara:strand:+ start:4434 stop:6086 length:1653 start_codon:yes stop_codon:yes gene_type:complete